MSIEKVAAQALETFAKKQPMSSFQDNLKELMNLASQLTITDVFLTKEFVNQPDPDSVTNPVGYMEVFKDKYVMINVFVFKQFSKIPLHDHPLMHGVLKVLSGKVKLTSYSLTDPHFVKHRDYNNTDHFSPVNYYYINDFVTMYETLGTPAIAHDPVIVSETDPAALLTPIDRNIHKVEAVDGPAAFLDILAPPYHTTQAALKRKCTYFHVMENARRQPLLCVNYFPAAYYTVDIPFTGPNLNETLPNILATYHRTRKPKIKN